jgi:hypothetical protein
MSSAGAGNCGAACALLNSYTDTYLVRIGSWKDSDRCEPASLSKGSASRDVNYTLSNAAP